jgi:hypothetical protein
MGKWQFTKEEVSPLLTGYGKQINKGSLPGIAPEIAGRVKAGRVVTGHGTDTRVLQYHLWVVGQVFHRHYFKYEVQHDPVSRYSGTADTNWAIQFWMNKIRGVYYERELVVHRVRDELHKIKLKGYQFEENKQSVSLIHRFAATTLDKVESELKAHMCGLINAVHPMFCEIVDAFGVEISEEERREIIKGTVKPSGLNRLSNAFGSAPEFNRNVPKGMRTKVLKRDGYRCQQCGLEGVAADFHADHIVPVSKEGLTVLENLQTLCSDCNLRKGGKYEK